MSYLFIKKILFITLFALTSVSIMANPKADETEYYNPVGFGFEFTNTRGHTSNLLTDSTDIADSYSTSTVRLKFRPASSIEMILYGDYTSYTNTINLNSSSKGFSLTFIPTDEESPFSAYFSVSFSGMVYDDLESYNNNNFSLIGSYSFQFNQTASIRAGMLFESTSYLFSDAPDNESYKIFHGINFSFLGSNSFDIEAGFSSMNFSYIPDTTYMLTPDPTGSLDYYHVKGDLNSFYISPRFSRPIGPKTGFNITAHYRKFINGDNAVILGSAVNFISPWGNIYEGQSITFSLKTKIIPKIIVSSGVGYWKKAYLKTMVVTDLYPVSSAETRNDEQNRFFFTLERPIFFKSGSILKPKLLIDITNNNTTSISMFDLYDYSSFSIIASLTYEL